MPTLIANAPASADGRGSRAASGRVHGFLLHLGKAVQRASIYPSGHPASQGIRPVAESLAALTSEGPVTIGVGRSRLLATGAGSSPVPYESPWLAARLFDRDVAVLTLTRDLDAHDLTRLVAWLAEKSQPQADAPFPEFPGATLARFDGAKLRFRETASPAPTPQADKAWWTLTAPLRTTYGIADRSEPGPLTLADEIRHALESSEGVGVGNLLGQIVALHGAIGTSSPADREQLLGRLADLVDQLAPEVRGTLFATSASDGPEKIALVEDLLPRLSVEVLADIAANVMAASMDARGPFARFVRKLATVAAGHPTVLEALDRRLAEAGIPASFFEHEVEGEAERAADDPGDRAPFVPAPYSRRLDELAGTATVAGATARATPVAFAEPALDEHLARIAVLALRDDLSAESADAFLPCLAEILPREAARGATDTLTLAADLVLGLRISLPVLSDVANGALESIESTFAGASTFDRTIATIIATDGRDEEAALWLAAGGRQSALAALRWMHSAPAPALRAKVAVALMALDEEAFVANVAPSLSEVSRVAEAFTSSLPVVEPARAIVCAIALSAHQNGKVRRRAIAWLLSVPLSAAKARLIVPRALDEPDEMIVNQALDVIERQPGAGAIDALIALVERRVTPDLRQAQARAMRALTASSEGVGVLAATLRRRRWSCAKADRLSSIAMAEALARVPSDAARAAVAAWRRSPAGLLSLFTAPARKRS